MLLLCQTGLTIDADLLSNSPMFETLVWQYCTSSLNRNEKALKLTCRCHTVKLIARYVLSSSDVLGWM